MPKNPKSGREALLKMSAQAPPTMQAFLRSILIMTPDDSIDAMIEGFLANLAQAGYFDNEYTYNVKSSEK